MSVVTGKKASVEGSARTTRAERARRSAVAAPRPRPRGHTLAPEHIGEAGSAAVLTLAILGLSTFIAAIGCVGSAGSALSPRLQSTSRKSE